MKTDNSDVYQTSNWSLQWEKQMYFCNGMVFAYINLQLCWHVLCSYWYVHLTHSHVWGRWLWWNKQPTLTFQIIVNQTYTVVPNMFNRSPGQRCNLFSEMIVQRHFAMVQVIFFRFLLYLCCHVVRTNGSCLYCEPSTSNYTAAGLGTQILWWHCIPWVTPCSHLYHLET